MLDILRNLLLLLPLSLWIGAGTFMIFFTAPIIFELAPTRTLSGEIVSKILSRLAWFEWGLIISLLFSELIKWLWAWPDPAKWEWIKTILIILLICVELVSLVYLSPKIENLRAQIPSFDDIPKDNPLRKQFGMYHGIMMLCMSISLGLGAIILLIHFVPKTP